MTKHCRLVFLALLSVLVILFQPVVRAQEEERVFDFDQAYQDYTYNYNLYLGAHKEYLVAKNQYETFQTLTSKTIALEQTTKMLQARDEVVATFLTAYRIRFADKTNVATGTLNLLYLQLEQEAEWYREHRLGLTSAGTIPDLITLSNEAQNRYGQTQSLVYQSLLEMYLYQESLLHNQLDKLVAQVETTIAGIRTEGEKDTTSVERWLLETQNRKTRGEEKLAEAQAYEITSRDRRDNMLQTYNRTVAQIEESHQYLKEANKALQEIIKEIRRAD